MKRPLSREKVVVVVEPRWKTRGAAATAGSRKGAIAAGAAAVAASAIAREKAGPYVEKAGPLVDSARERTVTAVDAARERTVSAVDAARPHLESAVDSVRSAARENVLPAVQETASRASEKAEEVAPRVVAAVGGAVSTALLASEPIREEALSRGGAAIAALKGEVVVAPKRKGGGKVRRLFSLAALLGAVGAGVVAWRRSQASDPWSVPASTGRTTGIAPVATPAPAPAPVVTPVVTDTTATTSHDLPVSSADAGGADPAEVVADVTTVTPEFPVDVNSDEIRISTPPASVLDSAPDAPLAEPADGSHKVHGDVFEVTEGDGRQV